MNDRPLSLNNLISAEEWAQLPDAVKQLLRERIDPDPPSVTPLPGQERRSLQEAIETEKSLNRLFQAIHSSLDLQTIFQTVTTETGRLLKGLDCLLVQYFPEEKIWRHIAEHHENPDAPSVLSIEIPDANNPFADQLKQLQVVIVDDDHPITDPINQQLATQISGSWLLYPITLGDRLWGSLTVIATQHPWCWRPQHLSLIQAIVEQLAVTLYQAQLYQQVQTELAARRRIEAELQENKRIFQNMAANVPGAIFRYLLRPDGTDAVLYMSEGCLELWEIPPEAPLADAAILWEMVHPDDLEAMALSVQQSAKTLEPWRWRWRIITPSGREKWLEAAGRPAKRDNGDILWDTLILDVSDRQEAELARKDSEQRYRLLAENSNDLICLHSPTGELLYISPSCESLLGYQYQELLEQPLETLIHPLDRQIWRQEIRAVLAKISNRKEPITYRIRTKSGHYVWFETLLKPIENPVGTAGEVVQIQSTSRDVTQRVEVQRKLQYDALHDSLTGLPNRTFLIERLGFVLKKMRRHPDYHFALLFMDLDRFKVVNDSLGHLFGDQLLIEVAHKLRRLLREIDVAVRLGGDEFVILLEEIDHLQAPIRVAERIFQMFREPITIGDRPMYVSTSIGIVIGNHEYQDESALLRDADTAMYRAKNRGSSCYEIFDRQMHQQILEQLHLENDLRLAIARQEFVLYYQPTICLQSGELAGFEALIRWQHPDRGILSPGVFLELAEETSLITQIDRWALFEICRQLQQWRSQFPRAKDLRVSLNLSAQDLKQDDLLDAITEAIATYDLPAAALVLEITESIVIEDIKRTIHLLTQLRDHGFKVSIDDFGTGYSSMSYLHQLPIDTLKVDKSFVANMLRDQKNQQIVETIFSLSQCLDLKAIAEGIETQEELQQLQKLGYQFGQGYLFARPLPIDDVERLLARPQWNFFE